ncbi:tetratricopeptide repeat protein [Luteibaculum oceani]|nr:tetratricopeptide repeat protein [Luteibaculum oceani]
MEEKKTFRLGTIMLLSTRLLLKSILIVGLGACILLPSTAILAQKSERGEDLSLKDERKFQSLFFEAIKDKSLGNNRRAISALEECIKITEDEAAVWYELARLKAFEGSFYDAIRDIEKAIELEDNNVFYLELAAQLYRETEEYKKALNHLEKIVALKPGDANAYLDQAEIYEELGDLSKTEKLYAKAIEITGESLEISYRKIQAFVRAGKLNKAIQETDLLIEKFPTVPEIREMKADFYLMQNNLKEAISTLNKLAESNPFYTKTFLKLALIYVNQGNFGKAIEYAKPAFASKDLNIDDKMRLMLVFYESSNLDKTHVDSYIDLAQSLTEAHPQDGKSWAVYGDILYREDQIEKALENYRIVTQLAPEKQLIWERVLDVESRLGMVDSLLKHAVKCTKLFPSQPIFYLYSGLAHIQIENHDDATFILESGLALVINNPAMRVQFLNLIGDAYTALRKFNKADKIYEEALSIAPNNPLVLNNYSYSLSERNQNLKEAKKMIEAALSADPKNPSYLDTYAWILFKLNDYDKARLYIQRAVDAGGEDSGTILEHYGDILFKMGETENAVEYWLKAKSKEGYSDKLDEKIEKKKWLE